MAGHTAFYLTFLSSLATLAKNFGENAIICSINAIIVSNSTSCGSLQISLQTWTNQVTFSKRRLLTSVLEELVWVGECAGHFFMESQPCLQTDWLLPLGLRKQHSKSVGGVGQEMTVVLDVPAV